MKDYKEEFMKVIDESEDLVDMATYTLNLFQTVSVNLCHLKKRTLLFLWYPIDNVENRELQF